MKQAVVIGGSSGIGLSLAGYWIGKDYHVCILDRCAPNPETLPTEGWEYLHCNLLQPDVDLLEALAADPETQVLMLTAGFGRVADFEALHHAEIKNLLTVNAVSAIRVLRIFYDRIKSDADFYCGIMGSIAGLVSSPMFSVYAASKAALCRFTESVNIELEAAGVKNRILNVSPGSIPGTRFNGGENDPAQTSSLAAEIARKLLDRETLWIPDFEKTYGGVLERYHADPHAFGLSSYQYKQNSGRVRSDRHICIGYLSGTFDLFHIGHLNLLRRAREQCDYLIVGVHPDASHKGKETFIPFDERLAIVEAVQYVDKAVQSVPEDSDAWTLWHYDKLFVGSDYKGTERFRRYEAFFADKDVEIVYFPYTKGTSSTQIRDAILSKTNNQSGS